MVIQVYDKDGNSEWIEGTVIPDGYFTSAPVIDEPKLKEKKVTKAPTTAALADTSKTVIPPSIPKSTK